MHLDINQLYKLAKQQQINFRKTKHVLIAAGPLEHLQALWSISTVDMKRDGITWASLSTPCIHMNYCVAKLRLYTIYWTSSCSRRSKFYTTIQLNGEQRLTNSAKRSFSSHNYTWSTNIPIPLGPAKLHWDNKEHVSKIWITWIVNFKEAVKVWNKKSEQWSQMGTNWGGHPTELGWRIMSYSL